MLCQSSSEFFFLSLVCAPDQVINYREVPLSDFRATSQCKRGPRSLPPLWHTELIGLVRGRTLSVRQNRSGCEFDTLPPSSDEVKIACSSASTRSHDVMNWRWSEDRRRLCTHMSSLRTISLCIPFLCTGFSFPFWDSNHYRSYFLWGNKIVPLGIFVESFWLWLTFSVRATARPEPSISGKCLNFVLWQM